MKRSTFFFWFVFYSLVLNAQIDFENSVPPNWTSTNGTLTISNAHYKLGSESLKWSWNSNAVITINNPAINSSEVLDYYHHTAELWVYNSQYSSDHITFEFFDSQGNKSFYFDFKLNYIGWRRITRSYKYDMHAINGASSTISKVKIKAPNTSSGTLYFDDWEYVKSRQKRRKSRQMPDVSGFLSEEERYIFDNVPVNLPLNQANSTEIANLSVIRTRIINDFQGNPPSSSSVNDAQTFYNDLNIIVSGNQIKGKHVSPVEAGTAVLTLAKDYVHNGTVQSLQQVEKILWLINDAGYAGGSELVYGWYNTRNYFKGVVLAFQHLSPSLQEKLSDAIRWTLKMGEFWETSPNQGWDLDVVHTNLKYMLGTTVFDSGNNVDETVLQLKGFKQYLERKNVPSSTKNGGLKPDGTSFHHEAHYPAYQYAYNSYVNVLEYLDGTVFQINAEAYKEFRDAAYTNLIFCNGQEFANSLCGRHPFELKNRMVKSAYNKLAYLGGSILAQNQSADPFLAKAYNRIWNDDPNLNNYGVEQNPEGFWQFNYSPAGVYRKDNWVVTIKGLNKTYWGTETYVGENRYGRYQSYGALEVMYSGGLSGSGKSIEGYDWNKVPGTTSKVLSWEELEGESVRVDERSKYDFAAALRFDEIPGSLKGNQGRYGMYAFDFGQLMLTSTHEEEFTFKKSVFCFDDFMVCTGSGIRSNDQQHEIITTLFQNKLSTQTSSTFINQQSVNAFPFSLNLPSGLNWLINSWGTGFVVKSTDEIGVTRKNQLSPDESGGALVTNGDVESAWIKHGTAPNSDKYEYVVKPNTNQAELQNFVNLLQSGSAPYEVIYLDDDMHIVKHNQTGTVGYALFHSHTAINGDLISNNKPCLVMLRRFSGGLKLTLVDPSTSYLQNGPIYLKLNGVFQLQYADSGVDLVNTNGGVTTLLFNPKDGNPLDVVLSNTVSGNSINQVFGFESYPSPVREEISITILLNPEYKSSNQSIQVDAKIIDLQGNEKFSNKFEGTHFKIDVHDLNPGIYFIKINERLVQKFVKE